MYIAIAIPQEFIFNTIATSAPYHPVINGETEHYVQALNKKQDFSFSLSKRDFSFYI